MAFFAAATNLGFLVMLAGTGVAYASGSSLSAAVTRGAIGFGITLIAGYIADVVAMGAPAQQMQESGGSTGPLIRTITALSEGAAGAPPATDDYEGERQLAA